MHLTIGDRLHPDSINLLLQSWITSSNPAAPLLLGKTDDAQGDWLIALLNSALEEFRPVAMLRRLRPERTGDTRAWKHFPMQPAELWEENHPERQGQPLQIDSLASLPACNMVAVQAVASELKLPLGQNVSRLVDCLLCCAKFPFLASLSAEIATLDCCLTPDSPHTSLDLAQCLHKIQVILSVAELTASTKRDLPNPPTNRFPSAQDLLNTVSATLKYLDKYVIRLAPSVAPDELFLRQLQLLFEGELGHMPGRHAEMIDQPKHWAGREKVQLRLK